MLAIVIVQTTILLAVSSGSAYGYIDPATGSIMVQVIIGAVASLLFLIKLYWKKVKRLFGVRRNESSAHVADSEK
jgi:O-antigen/teichoic acid export membrane protein